MLSARRSVVDWSENLKNSTCVTLRWASIASAISLISGLPWASASTKPSWNLAPLACWLARSKTVIQGLSRSISCRPLSTAITTDAAAAAGPSMAVMTGMMAVCMSPSIWASSCDWNSMSCTSQPTPCSTSTYLRYQAITSPWSPAALLAASCASSRLSATAARSSGVTVGPNSAIWAPTATASRWSE